MSCTMGNKVRVTLFGQSHSAAIGVVIDGLPAGETIDESELRSFMARRAGGRNTLSTARSEADEVKILSGLVRNKTCGAPLCAAIENNDIKSSDYERFSDIPRPSHADFTAHAKYSDFHDIRGGGQFSGRITAALCCGGNICAQILRRRGVSVGAHISSIHGIDDIPFDPVNVSEKQLIDIGKKEFPTVSDAAGELMRAAIEAAREEKDSVGGIIECAVCGLAAGVGSAFFGALESLISQAVFAVPAVKGIEFGEGFNVCRLYGSENNDELYYEKDEIRTRTNHSGGIQGGISNGMPIIFRTAIKPTPSIGIPQNSISYSQKKDVSITVTGRHDPCIVHRAVPVIEAVCAAVILDALENN